MTIPSDSFFVRHFASRRGLTLAELLIATVIVTVIGLGLGAASLLMRKLDSNYARDTNLYMKLNYMAEDIRYAASKAIGTLGDQGIRLGTGTPPSYMCFRIAATGGTPWRCYSPLASGGARDLYSCDKATPAACSNADKFMGKLVSNVFTNGTCSAPSFNPGSGDYNFRFKLIVRRDPTAGASPNCTAALNKGTSDNPQEVIEYSIFPEAHSF